MATSNFNTNYQVDWDFVVTSQNVASNTSKAYGRLIVRKRGGSGYHASAAPAFQITGFGPTINATWGPYDFRNTTEMVIWSGTRTFTHASDGTLNFNTRATVAMYDAYSNSVDGVVTLAKSAPRIPRTSVPTIQGGSNLAAGGTMIMDTNRASTAFTHTIWLHYGEIVSQINTSTVGSQFTWSIPMSLLSQYPDDTRRSGFLRVFTEVGGDRIGYRDVGITIGAPSSVVPTIGTVALVDTNTTVVSTVGAYVEGLSRLKATISATGAYGSTIDERTFSVDGLSANSGGVVDLDVAGSRTVTARVTDSRGRAATKTTAITVLAYEPPKGTMTARRAVGTGAPNDAGTYIRVDLTASAKSLKPSTAETNDLVITAATRVSGTSTWTNRPVTQPTGLTHNTNFLINGGGIFPVTSSYDVRVTIADKFGSMTIMDQVATAVIAVDFNGNAGVGIGKYHARGALDVDGDVYVKGFRTGGYVYNTNAPQPPQDYPRGVSVGDAGSGWPTSTGIVVTYNFGQTRCFQEVTARVGASRWYRGVNPDANGVWAWTDWIQTDYNDTPWTNSGAMANSFVAASDAHPQYRIKDGIVYLRGGVTRTAAPTGGLRAFNLPVAAAPVGSPVRITTRGANTEIVIDTDGSVTVVSPDALGGAGYSLSGISYPMD